MAIIRSILVDDTSPLIQYEGPWFSDATGSQDALGNLGPVFNKTLHGTQGNATFTFAYSGTNINVVGTINLRDDTSTPDPQWECSVDGILLPNNPSSIPNNNWYLCNSASTPVQNEDGPHILTVRVTVRQNQTFWLDRLIYTPSSDVPLNDKIIVVENYDPQIQYGSGWAALKQDTNSTSQTGSTLSFSFIGVSLSWFGVIATGAPQVPTSATFSIDSNAPTSFEINALPADALELHNQKLFSTPEFPPGPHTLNVIFLGNENTASLVLDYLIVQNGTAAQATPLPIAPNQTSQTAQGSIGNNTSQPLSPSAPVGNSSRDSSRDIPLGPILGGVLGAVVILLTGLLVYRGRNRPRKQMAPFQYHRTDSRTLTTSMRSHLQSSHTDANVSPDVAPQFLPSSKLEQYQQRTLDISPDSSSVSPSSNPSTSSLVHHVTTQSPSTNQSLSSGGVVVHQDSGMRYVFKLPLPPQRQFEVPPLYTAA